MWAFDPTTKPSLVPPRPAPDRRIDALEQKLDAVLKELEAQRKSKAPSKNKSSSERGTIGLPLTNQDEGVTIPLETNDGGRKPAKP